MGYFDDWFEGEQVLDLDEMNDFDVMVDPFDGDTGADSPFEEDYFDNIDLYRFNTDRHMQMYRDE